MKKLITLCFVLFISVIVAHAQVTVKGSKFADNWSIGIAAGGYTPFIGSAFFESTRPSSNIIIAKQFTPIFGMGVEGAAYFNANKFTGIKSKNVVDVTNISLLNFVNLHNLFCEYKGSPRMFELVVEGGLGWGNELYAHQTDYSFLSGKAGLDFNFNLSTIKAWQINIKPAVVWDLETLSGVKCNGRQSMFELTAGVTYKFNNSYGAHNFVVAKLYDQAEIDGLNAKINDLRSNVSAKESEVNAANAKVKELQNELNDCRNQKPAVAITKTVYDCGSMVTFRQGKSIIDRSQYANVERVASYMKNHKDVKVEIKGYASPEGTPVINAKLAKNRAEAVKNMLVKKYGISNSRINASGEGVGNLFSEPDWNRVSISTLK